MVMRALLILLFGLVCEAQWQNPVPSTFEGWLKWHTKQLNDISKIKDLNKQLLQLSTSPYLMQFLSDRDAFRNAISDTNISKACQSALLFAAEHPKSTWSVNMLDAIAKPPPAIKEGAVHWVGGFQECMGNQRPINWTKPGKAPRSHYCKQTYGMPYTSPLSPAGGFSIDVGVCVPETCSPQDITIFTYLVMYELGVVFNRSLTITNYALCYVRQNEMTFSNAAIAMIVICVIFGVIMLAGTIFDIFCYQRRKEIHKEAYLINKGLESGNGTVPVSNGVPYEAMRDEDPEANKPETVVRQPLSLHWWEKMLLAFSVYTNIIKILDTSQQPDRLNCLDGIRFLSMSWVILGHTYFFVASTTNNLAAIYPILNTWSYQAIMNATFSVDSFFVLSGLLTGYIFLRETAKMGTMNNRKFWALYFFHRFWRLTPPYMLFLGFYTALAKYMANGPMWNQLWGVDAPNCEANWWYNLLYINNFIGAAKMCMGWSWYLANDMQFHYFVAPIILPLIFFSSCSPHSRSRFLALVLTVMAVLTGSVVSLAVVSVDDNINVSLAGNGFDVIYIKPWCRVGAYVVGLVTAYAILEHKKGRFRVKKPLVVLAWMFAIAISLATLYGLAGVNHGDYKISEGISALYNAMSRLTWSIGLSWLIFACICGYGGWINTFLSWKAFIPLSRLTYSAYLVHPVIMTIVYGSSLQAHVVSELSLVYFFFGNMVAAYLVALLLTLTWESPLIGLERILLRK